MSRESVWCLFFLGIFGFALCRKVDRAATPSCEDLGPQDVYLNFSHVGLTKLTKSFVSSATIKCLNLEGNDIYEVDTEAFIGLPELRYLNIAGARILYSNFIQTALPNLKTLILDGSVNPNNWNPHLPHTFLLPELEKLSLRDYKLRNWETSVTALIDVLVAPKLSHLYISGNGLYEIDMLHVISKLTTLNLDDNYVRYTPGEQFQNLEVLSIDRNRIKKLCWSNCHRDSWTLRGMRNLQYLSLAGNKIEVIESEAFDDMGNLVVLNLAANTINYFPPHTFDSMSNLKNLTLDDNKLIATPRICTLTKLEVISLNRNKIDSVDETTFCSLQNLAIIRLRKNDLTSISDGSFADLPSLIELDLSWNKIHTLSKKWIAPKTYLKFLNLDGNDFNDISNMSLEGINNIDSLSMGYNPIEIISVGTLMDLSPNITIDVSRIYDHPELPQQ